MELKATVYKNRDYCGILEVWNEGKVVKKFNISAKSDPELGIPNPPVGQYRIIDVQDVSEQGLDVVAAYGESIIFFDRVGGSHVRPNFKNEFIMSIHGGLVDTESNIPPTDGGLRLRNSDMAELLRLVTSRDIVNLQIVEKSIGLITWFTRPKIGKYKARRIRPHHGRRQGLYGGYYYDDDDFPYWLMLYYMWDEGEPLDSGVDQFDDVPVTEESGPDFSNIDPPFDPDPPYEPAPVEPEPEPPLIVEPFVPVVDDPPSVSAGAWTHSDLGEESSPPADEGIFTSVVIGSEEASPSGGFSHVDLGSSDTPASDAESSSNWSHTDLGETSVSDDANGTGY